VNPLAGVIVIVEDAVCPAGTLRVVGVGVIVKGIVTVTVVAAETELLCDPSPSYVAVTLLDPVGSAVVAKVAVPVVAVG
jgi:hypothetical protein